MLYINHSGKYIEINFNRKIPCTRGLTLYDDHDDFQHIC